MLQTTIDFLIRQRWLLLLLALFITGISIYLGQQLKFDRSIEKMFSPDDPLLIPYTKLKQTFGGNEIVLGIYQDEQFLNPDRSGLQRLKKIRLQIEALPGVSSVLSLDQLDGQFVDILAENKTARNLRALFVGFTHNQDATVVALPCMLVPEAETSVDRSQLVNQIREIVTAQPGGMITGEPVMVVDGFRYVEEDGARLGWATSLLLAVVIFVTFRSVRWVIISIAIVQFTLWLTRGLLVLIHFELSMVSSMLTAIVTVVGIATVIHILIHFRQYRAQGTSPEQSLKHSLETLAVPIFWACATDAVGFCSLLVTSVGPVHDFGIMMAIGALFVLLAVAMLLPGLVLFLQGMDDPAKAWGEDRLDNQLQRVIHWISQRPGPIMVVTSLLLIIAIYGSTQLEVESDFTKNFKSDTPIVIAYQTVEEELGGAGVWDLMLPAPKNLNWNYLQAVLKLEDRLRNEAPELTKVLSLADAMTSASPYPLENMPTNFVRNRVISMGLTAFDKQMPEMHDSLFALDPENQEQAWFRVMLRAPERQDAKSKKALIAKVQSITKDFDTSEFTRAGLTPREAQVTGFFVLLTNLIDSLIQDQWTSFLVAILGIGFTMTLAFRSPLYAAVALVPNVLPVLMVTGIIGITGTPINMGAAMIAAVSMGLSVDSSIHYIIGFQREINAGNTVANSLATVQQQVGRAVIFATLALIVGFSVLCFSNFIPTVYFGVLVSLAMLGGLAGNLIVLPLLLKLVTKESKVPAQFS